MVKDKNEKGLEFEAIKQSVRAMDEALNGLYKNKVDRVRLGDEVGKLVQDRQEQDPEQISKRMTDLQRKLVESSTEKDYLKSKVRYAAFHVLAEMEIW